MTDNLDEDKREAEKIDQAWKKKKIEFIQQESDGSLDNRQILKEWIRRSIDGHGNIPPKIRDKVDNVGKDFGITVDDVVEEVMEEQVLEKGGKVNDEKLAFLLLQKAQRLRDQNGGIMTSAEALLMAERGGCLSGKLRNEDIEKAVEILSKQKLIPGMRKLSSGLKIIYFFPIEFSPDQNTVLSIASEQGWTTLEEVMMRTSWSRERAELTLGELERAGISRLDSSYSAGKKWYFPGFITQ